VVTRGHTTGLFTEWYGPGQALEAVSGFSKAVSKKFSKRSEAQAFWQEHCSKQAWEGSSSVDTSVPPTTLLQHQPTSFLEERFYRDYKRGGTKETQEPEISYILNRINDLTISVKKRGSGGIRPKILEWENKEILLANSTYRKLLHDSLSTNTKRNIFAQYNQQSDKNLIQFVQQIEEGFEEIYSSVEAKFDKHALDRSAYNNLQNDNYRQGQFFDGEGHWDYEAELNYEYEQHADEHSQYEHDAQESLLLLNYENEQHNRYEHEAQEFLNTVIYEREIREQEAKAEAEGTIQQHAMDSRAIVLRQLRQSQEAETDSASPPSTPPPPPLTVTWANELTQRAITTSSAAVTLTRPSSSSAPVTLTDSITTARAAVILTASSSSSAAVTSPGSPSPPQPATTRASSSRTTVARTNLKATRKKVRKARPTRRKNGATTGKAVPPLSTTTPTPRAPRAIHRINPESQTGNDDDFQNDPHLGTYWQDHINVNRNRNTQSTRPRRQDSLPDNRSGGSTSDITTTTTATPFSTSAAKKATKSDSKTKKKRKGNNSKQRREVGRFAKTVTPTLSSFVDLSISDSDSESANPPLSRK
jgi:hypothetical protein